MNEQGHVGTFDALQSVRLCATFMNLLPSCPTVIVMFSPKYGSLLWIIIWVITVSYGMLIVSQK